MTATPPPPATPPTVHLPAQATGPAVSGTVIPSSSWPVRPGPPSASSTPPSTAPAPVSTPAPAAGGSGDWLWKLPPSPPMPPGGGGMAPWLPPQPPAPYGPPQQIDVHVTVHQPVPVEPDLTWWQRLARAVPYRVTPLRAVTAVTAAIVPLPHLGYGAGRIWGSLLHHIGTDIHPAVSHVAAAVAVAVVAARIHRPCRIAPTPAGGWVRQLTWLDAFGVAITVIGGSWGVLVPDAVAFLTGVRA